MNTPPDAFTPSAEEAAKGMVTKNACQCSICGANADRFKALFVCQQNGAHMADLYTGIFTDLTFPRNEQTQA